MDSDSADENAVGKMRRCLGARSLKVFPAR